ncbi:MAG: hypothetical protein RIQ72_164 [Candidatus Parcubacteria bacterium]
MWDMPILCFPGRNLGLRSPVKIATQFSCRSPHRTLAAARPTPSLCFAIYDCSLQSFSPSFESRCPKTERKYRPCRTVFSFSAETEGFEPSRPFNGPASLAVRCFRPAQPRLQYTYICIAKDMIYLVGKQVRANT